MKKSTNFTQKMKRLLVWAFFALFTASAFAADFDNDPSGFWETSWSATWVPQTGKIRYAIKCWQDYGGQSGGNSGFLKGSGNEGIKLTVMGYSFKIGGDTDGSGIVIESQQCPSDPCGNVDFSVSGQYTNVTSANNGGKYRVCYISVPVPQNQTGKSIEAELNGVWWRYGLLAGDQKVEGLKKTVITTIDNIKITAVVEIPSNNGNTPAVKIAWSKPQNLNWSSFGTVYLCDENGSQYSGSATINASNASGSFFIDVPKSNAGFLDNSHRFKIKQRYETGNGLSTYYEQLSDVTIVNAYPQAKNFQAEYDPSKKQVQLTWELSNAPGDNVITDDFVIIADDGTTSDSYTVAYRSGNTAYSCSVPVSEGINTTYTYSLYRKTLENWTNSWKPVYTETISNYPVNSVHMKPFDAAVSLSNDNKTATVTWDITGQVWSSGSKFIIYRINISGGSEDITLSKADFEKKTYTDNLIRMCNEYQYKLLIIPNESYESIQPVYTESITPTKIGTITSATASKGYYSDRVEINWTTQGGFDEFALLRKPYGTPDSLYKQIATINGSSVQNTFMTKDDTGQPGVVYEYWVKGLLSCGGEIIEGNKDNPQKSIGFRTPTGDFYGRVTFENGQGEENVEINVTTEEDINSYGLQLTAGQTATVDNTGLLENQTAAVTLQAWVSPDNNQGKIISKDGMYTLGINNDRYYFTAGDKTLTVTADALKASALKAKNSFTHLTGVYTGSRLIIYIDGDSITSLAGAATITGNANPISIGGGFDGYIDEVRIWNRALDSANIKRDYNRYIVGNEAGLIAYYTFNYATETEFYDLSFRSADYNANHGKMNGATLSAFSPSVGQLGYKGVTRSDGSYEVRAVPYKGNGTAYNLMPHLGIHQFEAQKEVRFLSPSAQSHTVNFIDKSSFRVQGFVTYNNSIIPVEGVNFSIDGKLALKSNGIPEATNANGEFIIYVPVGVHEVKATMANHTFVGSGRITNPYGADLNYQDSISGIELQDNTTVKFIGRVAGGTVQEAYPLGHSLSKNNLADGITVTLTHTKTASLSFANRTVTEAHFKPSKAKETHVNRVEYKDNTVIIQVNDTTGEFVANVIPEQFTVKVDAGSKHPDIPGSGSLINLTQQFNDLNTLYEYADSVTNYSDTVHYNFAQKYIKRYEPMIRVNQLDSRNEPVSWFGSDSITVANILNETTTVYLINKNNGAYTLGKPVFVQHNPYKFKLNVFEQYIHYRGNEMLDTDEVPTQDARFQFNNDIADNENRAIELTADSTGTAIYPFKGGDIELTSAVKRLSLKVVYGATDNPRSIDWEFPASFVNGEAYILGSHQTGVDFVTSGPDNVLTVLRDPPGSKSYSFLEKGTSFSSSRKYTGKITNTGSEMFKVGLKMEVITFTGVGAGVITKTADQESGITLGVEHQEEYEGQDGRKSTTTTTTRFQTSDHPYYVGADGDLFIGNSTNLTFGTTENITIVPREHYNEAPDAVDRVYNSTSSPDYVLVLTSGKSASLSFGTLFAYPQIHIEERLIPQLKEIRNDLLLETQGYSIEQLQAVVEADPDKVFYYSYLPPGSPDFGKNNSDNQEDSYKIIYNPNKNVVDTINSLNQSINNWIARLSDNEKAKKEAVLKQNYSFHAGSKIEYSESYSQQVSHQSTFTLMLGGKIGNSFYFGGSTAVTTKFEFEEHVNTTQGGIFDSEAERSHNKGFVLDEDGLYDYLTVDVLTEKAADDSYDIGGGAVNGDGGSVDLGDIKDKEYFPSFVFRTMAGATSCPYEDAYTTKYYEPGKHKLSEATKRIEVPFVDMTNKFVENVPSGETAKLTLLLRNNSETQSTGWYNLKIVSESNPNGARMYIDGAAIGNGLEFVVPAGETIVKTLEVGKGSVMNYDGLKVFLQSQCQIDIADTVTFTVHFTPSCTSVNVRKPSDNWTYNTKLPVAKDVYGIDKHYMEVQLDGFNVNYDNFHCIRLQYKPASQSDEEWITLMNYYADSALYKSAVENGLNAEMIKASDAGTIRYNFFMDDMADQYYDLRAVGVCSINNEEVYNMSAVRRGIKDTYLPRLFGNPQPANGILGVGDDIRINFNEPIADGLLTRHNFQVRGLLNGATTDHSTSVRLDGINNYLDTEFDKNLQGKSLTAEMWIQPDKLQNATLFSHGSINNSLELSITSNNRLALKIGETTATSVALESPANPSYADGSWAHVALVYNAATNRVSAYYNYTEVISQVAVATPYAGIGNVTIGKSIASGSNNYAGKIHNIRVWEKVVDPRNLQLNSLLHLAGIEESLMSYYPLNEGRGELGEDRARGANLTLHGSEWSLPEGRSARINGVNYLKLDGGTAAFTKEMDYTVELWFKAEPGQTNATIIGAGSGETGSNKPDYGFAIGFDGAGKLSFTGNEVKTTVNGEYRDNNWHHFAFSVDRTKGRGQIYIDGNLSNYIEASNIGGIANDFIYVGARGWYSVSNPTTLKIDNHFRGAVDDIRFWELYRTEAMTRDNNNVKLSGEEIGLVHYYPFDSAFIYNGTKFVEFTNLDKRISHTANPETDVMTVAGGTFADVASTDIPPIKDAGPVSNLEFDFTVNNDALIITLKEPEYRIARSIITFTVTDVRDRNGNSTASPITWSAYVDRNQLRWETDRVDISKQEYEPYEFKVKATNQGGAIRSYTITNAPSWLTVTPSSGTLQPKAYNVITFSINEGLNTGTYNETVYLVNEDGVPEPLALNITVQGEKPDWKVNPADFKYNMSVFGKLRFDNIFSTDKNDMLAAFNKKTKQCIGVTNSYYDKTLDMWYAMLTVYSNETTVSAADLEFRSWDASTGKTYKAEPDRAIAFKNNDIIGAPNNLVIFDGKEIFFRDIHLTNGWNWISFNLKPENNDLKSVLAQGHWTAANQIKNRDEFYAYSPGKSDWVSSTGQTIALNNTSMYKLHSTGEQVLSISGSAIDLKATPVEVTGGGYWNYIGYLTPVNTTVKEALAGYNAQAGDIIKSQTAFAMYSNNEWVGMLGYMEANKGYMLYRGASGNTRFTYPQGSATLRASASGEDANLGFAENMTVVATALQLQPGDVIKAYINGEPRGEGKHIATGNDSKTLNFITVQGAEQGANIRFDLERNGEMIGSSYNEVRYVPNAIAGTVKEPLVLNFGFRENTITLYPNPFVNELHVEIFAKEGAEIQISVADLFGRTVLNNVSRTATGQFTKIGVNGSSLPPAIYLLNVSIDGKVSTYKIVKK